MKVIDSAAAIEAVGYKVVATTKCPEGMSFDAHRVVGKRVLVRGPVGATHEEAMLGLYRACIQRNVDDAEAA